MPRETEQNQTLLERSERKADEEGCTEGGGEMQVKPSRNSMTHSKDLGASYVVKALLPVSVCV